MVRLRKYIQPYWKSILLAIVMVVVVAAADLSLPDLLSQIINVGIQQRGIESGAPDALSIETMQSLQFLQSEQDYQLLTGYYELVEPGSKRAVDLLQEIPVLEEEPVYVLKPLDDTGKLALEDLVSKPLIFIRTVNLLQNDPEQAKQLLGENFPTQMMDIPPDVDLGQFLQVMPAEQRAALETAVSDHLSSLEGAILHQLTVQAITAEYARLRIDTQKTQNQYILNTGFRMIMVAVVGLIASLIVSFLASRTAADVARDVRSAIFKKVESFTTAEFEKFSTASLITRTTNDVTQVQMVVFMLMRMAFQAPLIGTLGIFRALDQSPGMWWTIALIVGLLVIVIVTLFAIVAPKFKIIQQLIDRLNLVMRENLSGILVVRAFNKQSYEEKRFDNANLDVTDNQVFIGRAMAFVFPLMNLVMLGGQVLIIAVGARFVAESALQVGSLIAFMQYSMQIFFSFMQLSMLFIFIPRAAVSGDRIADVLETPILIKDPQEPTELEEPVRGVVEFHDVDFRYPDAEEDVLHDISFRAEPGEVTAIIGSTGSGKSTLVKLLPRFFDVTKGAITLDGVDIRQLTQHELREQIGYAPQKGLLFSGTVASNLEVGKPGASEEEMLEAIQIAQAKDFVLKDEDGMNMEISQGGTNVSGGQKQRLSIARAVIKKPPVFIFDDTFSALDYKTDAALRKELHQNLGDSTLLVVTQRVATAKLSDQILVLDNGRVVGIGKHNELMQSCKTYREIASSQLNEEELA
ncbi:MAG: ABC transporter ATP-binding protein [Anaerolineaceae bacterium]|jgi:ATP-binding cassette subfamily B protein|nr:ABC transporter ATP-binding protein [Anaerolineaceae bacterium]MDD4042816.1 ABC transporter ATP-binding protein [Anaerolineaceae bacterium]